VVIEREIVLLSSFKDDNEEEKAGKKRDIKEEKDATF
jgi:hypothetical protein